MSQLKIIIANFLGIGDIIRSTPLITAMRKKYPSSYIVYLTKEPHNTLLETNPFLDEVFTFPQQQLNQAIKEDIPAFTLLKNTLYDFISLLQSIEFDIAICPPQHVDPLLATLLRAKKYVGATLNEHGTYTTYGQSAQTLNTLIEDHLNEQAIDNHRHYVDLLLDLLEEFNISLDKKEKAPALFLSLSSQSFANNFLHDHGLSEQDMIVGINPASAVEEKRWAVERFAALADKIIETYKCSVVFTGSQLEAATVVDDIQKLMVHTPLIAAGKTTLLESCALINKCSFFISNVSGPMHLAAALNVPTLGLFGRDFPFEARPYGTGHIIAVQNSLKELSVEEVYEGISYLMAYHSNNGLPQKTLSTLLNHKKHEGLFLFTDTEELPLPDVFTAPAVTG